MILHPPGPPAFSSAAPPRPPGTVLSELEARMSSLQLNVDSIKVEEDAAHQAVRADLERAHDMVALQEEASRKMEASVTGLKVCTAGLVVGLLGAAAIHPAVAAVSAVSLAGVLVSMRMQSKALNASMQAALQGMEATLSAQGNESLAALLNARRQAVQAQLDEVRKEYDQLAGVKAMVGGPEAVAGVQLEPEHVVVGGVAVRRREDPCG